MPARVSLDIFLYYVHTVYQELSSSLGLGLKTLSDIEKKEEEEFKRFFIFGFLVMSATNMLGHQDVLGLSAIDPCLRQWISILTIPKDVCMPF